MKAYIVTTGAAFGLLALPTLTGLHCFRTLPPLGEGVSALAVVKAGVGLYRPGDGALVSFSLFLAPRVEILSRNVDWAMN